MNADASTGRGGWDHGCLPRDSVDALLSSWTAQRADLDFGPLAVVARLERIRSHIDDELEGLFVAHGLTAANFAVLVTLSRIGDDRGVSQRRLMDELGLTSGTISVRMDRLIDEGLIERRADPESKRNTLITLTDRGRELFERVVPAHLANERRLLAALEPDEEELLTSLLRKLLVEFEGSLPPVDARLRLGLVVAPAHVTIEMRESVGLEPLPGLLVRGVADDGPAAQAGIHTGDVLLRAGGRALRGVAALYSAIDAAAAGGRLKLLIVRGQEQRSVTLKLGTGGGIDGALAATAGRSARGEHVL
jgi:DNA-binding MarR family transcriptional regulator